MQKSIYFFLFYQILKVLSQRCLPNENNCKLCDSFNKYCVECNIDILIPDDNGGCIGAKECYLGENYCEKCNEEGNLCNLCEIGYFPDDNGGCSYTNNCELSYKGECLKCKKDYILIGNNSTLKICKSIFNQDLKNCKIINKNNGLCDTCEEGFYLNEGDKRCIKTQNCHNSNYGNCKKCISGYYLDKKENICKIQKNDFVHCLETINGKTCDKYEKNYYFDFDEKCVSTNFCSKSENFECKECISGFYLAEDKSCSKEKNCKSAYRDTGICNWCSDNYYLNQDNKCIPYSDSTKELKYCKLFQEKCLKCEENYTFDEDEKCVKTKNCSKSDDGICSLCSKGYYLGNDKKCTNKEHCIYSNSEYVCIECEDNYYWDNYWKTCKFIGNNSIFENCKLSYNGYQCSSCKNGYYFNNTDNLCYDNNIKNDYYKCAKLYAGICTSCEEGYFFGYMDYKCSKIEFCLKSQDENTCIQCRSNYCLDKKTGNCINNEIINENINYYKCIQTNEEGSCEECITDYNLKEGLCYNEKDCIEKDGNTCLKCASKNDNSYSCLNNVFGCVDTKVKNCTLCDNIFDFNNCTKCEEGFELNEEGNCI